MVITQPTSSSSSSADGVGSSASNPLGCLGRVVNPLSGSQRNLGEKNSKQNTFLSGNSESTASSTTMSDSDEAEDLDRDLRNHHQRSGESIYALTLLEEAAEDDLNKKRPREEANHFPGYYSATTKTTTTAPAVTDTDSVASTTHSKSSGGNTTSLHPSTETAAQRRAVVKRLNTEKYGKSRNIEDEELANQTTDVQRQVQPTKLLDLIGQSVRGKRAIKSCLKKQETDDTDLSKNHKQKSPSTSSRPRRSSEEGTSSSSCTTQHVTPTSLARRNRRAVRFATNTNNRVWCLTQTFPKVSASLRDTLWWDSEELYDLYEEAYQALDEDEEDEYGYAIQAAFASVDHTSPQCTHALFNFGTFVSCNTVRGLEKNVYDVADHIQRHMDAVLATQRLIKEETWCGGMEDDLRQEILALRSFKYSHPSRMVSYKLGLFDHQILELYSKKSTESLLSCGNDSSCGLISLDNSNSGLLLGGEGSMADFIRDSSLYDEDDDDAVFLVSSSSAASVNSKATN